MDKHIHPDEHSKHLDNPAYQAAIERAAIQETGEGTRAIEERTLKNDEGSKANAV